MDSPYMSRDAQDNLLSMHYALTMSLGGGDSTTTTNTDTTNAAGGKLGPHGKEEYHHHQYSQQQQTLQQQHSRGRSSVSQLNSSDWTSVGNPGSNASSACFSDSIATWGGGGATGTAGGGHLGTSHLGGFSFQSPDDPDFCATKGGTCVGASVVGGNTFNHQSQLEHVAEEDMSPLVSGDPSSYLGFIFSLPTDIIEDSHHAE